MKEIEGTELLDLVAEAANELLQERRSCAKGQIKKELQRIEGLASDIKKTEKELEKLRKKFNTAQEKIDKLKSGDWSVLVTEQEK